jgi:hypothetical protein
MARFHATPLFSFPSRKKRCQELIKVLRIHSRHHVAVHRLAQHALSVHSKEFCQTTFMMPKPFRCSTQTRMSCQLCQDKQAVDQHQLVVFPLSAPQIKQLLYDFIERIHHNRFGDHSPNRL